MAGTWPATSTGWADANGSPRRAGKTRSTTASAPWWTSVTPVKPGAGTPIPPCQTAAWSGVQIVSAPTEEPDDPRFTALCGPYLNDPAYYVHNVRLFPEHIVAVFRAIADAAPAGGVVVHCAAGRDRSGMVAAMLQDLAGDSDGQIADAYAQAARAINERYRTHGPPHDRERYVEEAELAPLLEERGRAVVAFVRDLDTEGFLLRHGLTDAELHAVRSVLGVTVAQ